MKIFQEPEDFYAFERILSEAVERFNIRLLTYAVLSNRWHWVVWPPKSGELSNAQRRGTGR